MESGVTLHFQALQRRVTFKPASLAVVALALKHHSCWHMGPAQGKLLLLPLPFWKHIVCSDCHTCQPQSVSEASRCHGEAWLILPSRGKRGNHLFHYTAFCFPCNQQSLSWACKLQTTMVSGSLICNLPTRDDPGGPQQTFLELCISRMSCNLTHLEMR